jgi:peptidoglycan LD-endopeptidase LytH
MINKIDFNQYRFHPVIHLPQDYEVYDFTGGYHPERMRKSQFGVGRYNEKRPQMYEAALFKKDAERVRDIHVGIDIAAPVGTSVHAFFAGRIHRSTYNSAQGDYGATIVTVHKFREGDLYALHGHLSLKSLENLNEGMRFEAGDIIAWVGDESENGGWNPHLHFQLSYLRPDAADLPGVVNEHDLAAALEIYPDPRLVLGPLY